mgnify:CR=1 FL=1
MTTGRIDARVGGQQHAAGYLIDPVRYVLLMQRPSGGACDEVVHVVSRLREDGHGVMLITHDLEEALVADRVLVLRSGSVVFDGRPSEMTKVVDLDAVGLELPPIVRMVEGLRAAGLSIDGTSETAVIEAICRSSL